MDDCSLIGMLEDVTAVVKLQQERAEEEAAAAQLNVILAQVVRAFLLQ
jgi:hypothetical protein